MLANCLLAALAAAAAAAAAAVQCLQCSQHLPLSFAHFLHDSTNICAAFSLVFPLADMICFPLPLLPLPLSLSLLCCSLKPLKRLFVQAGRGRARVRCAINYSKIIYFAFMYAQIYAASFLPPPPPTHAAMQASVSLTTYPSSRTKSAELLQCNWLVSLSFRSTLTAKYLSFSREIFL